MTLVIEPEFFADRSLATRFFCYDYQDDQAVVPENFFTIYMEYSAAVIIFKNFVSDVFNYTMKRNIPIDFENADYQALIWDSVKYSVNVVYDYLDEEEKKKILPTILRYVYITLFDVDKGPRLGEFMKIFGIQNFIDKMTDSINNPFKFPQHMV